jgi:hypothetical protein
MEFRYWSGGLKLNLGLERYRVRIGKLGGDESGVAWGRVDGRVLAFVGTSSLGRHYRSHPANSDIATRSSPLSRLVFPCPDVISSYAVAAHSDPDQPVGVQDLDTGWVMGRGGGGVLGEISSDPRFPHRFVPYLLAEPTLRDGGAL